MSETKKHASSTTEEAINGVEKYIEHTKEHGVYTLDHLSSAEHFSALVEKLEEDVENHGFPTEGNVEWLEHFAQNILKDCAKMKETHHKVIGLTIALEAFTKESVLNNQRF